MNRAIPIGHKFVGRREDGIYPIPSAACLECGLPRSQHVEPCDSVLTIEGQAFACDMVAPHPGWAHANEQAGASWTWLTGIPLTLSGILEAATAPANALGRQLLGLAGAQIPGFGLLAPILGMVTPGRTDQTAGPISLPQIMLNIPGVIAALIGLLKFLFTSAHGRYWTAPIFGGMTAENHASALVTRLTS